MDHQKEHKAISRGTGRWQAPRLKPVVKKRGVKNRKKARSKQESKKLPD